MLVLVCCIGEGVGVGDLYVGGALISAPLRPGLPQVLQQLLPVRPGQAGPVRRLLMGDPHLFPGGKVPGEGALRGDGLRLLTEGQGQHGPGVGLEHRSLFPGRASGAGAAAHPGQKIQPEARRQTQARRGCPGPPDPAAAPAQAGAAGGPSAGPDAGLLLRPVRLLRGELVHQVVGQGAHGLQQAKTLLAHSPTPSSSRARARDWRRRRSRWLRALGVTAADRARSPTAAP